MHEICNPVVFQKQKLLVHEWTYMNQLTQPITNDQVSSPSHHIKKVSIRSRETRDTATGDQQKDRIKKAKQNTTNSAKQKRIMVKALVTFDTQ